MFGLGLTELLLVLVVVLVLFGAGKLPKVMGEMGKGISAFKKSVKGEDENENINAGENETENLAIKTPESSKKKAQKSK